MESCLRRKMLNGIIVKVACYINITQEKELIWKKKRYLELVLLS